MPFIRYAIVLAAIAAASQLPAATPAPRQVRTTGDLVELCSVMPEDPSYPTAMGFCLGYIDAVLDYHAALTAGARFNPVVCPHAGVTREQVVRVFLAWSGDNTRYLETAIPVEGVMRAIHEKWPCSGE
jgi:hypothetical protein